MAKKKRRYKTTRGKHTTGTHPEPLPADYVFEWKEEGQGWEGRFYDRLDNTTAHPPWGYMVIEPEGGLHGLWIWRFKWEERDPRAPVPFGLRSVQTERRAPGWITGRHEDADKATEICETCLRALLMERDRKYKEWWDALPDEPAQAS